MKFIKEEFKKVFLITRWVVGLYFKNYPVYTSINVISRIILAFAGLINAYIIAIATDEAIKLATGSTDLRSIYKIIFFIVGSSFFFSMVDIVNNYVWRSMMAQDWWKLREILAKKISNLGIS